jgi:hypothetical protein
MPKEPSASLALEDQKPAGNRRQTPMRTTVIMFGAGGVEKEVTFVEETEPGINDEIDAAYRTKYRRTQASPPAL